jgi:hypothetical protein
VKTIMVYHVKAYYLLDTSFAISNISNLHEKLLVLKMQRTAACHLVVKSRHPHTSNHTREDGSQYHVYNVRATVLHLSQHAFFTSRKSTHPR